MKTRSRLATDNTFLLIIAGLVLVLPSLFSGKFADDFNHQAVLEYDYRVFEQDKPVPFQLFSFLDESPDIRGKQLAYSLIPWWTADDARVHFWRPVAEASHWLDYRFLQGNSMMMHLENILLYATLLYLLTVFYQLLIPERKLVMLSLLVFIADSTHGFSVAWIANKNLLLAAIFSLAMLSAFLYYLKVSRYRFLLLSLACFCLALSSSEQSVMSAVFVVLFLVLADKSPLRKKFVAGAGFFLISLLWALFYWKNGFGVSGSQSLYGFPVDNMQVFISRFLTGLSVQYNLLPFHLVRSLSWLVLVSGFLILLFLFLAVLKAKSKPLRVCLLMVFVHLMLLTSTVIQDRLFLLVNIFAAVPLASFIDYLYQKTRALGKPGYAKLANILVFFHIVVSGVLMLAVSLSPSFLVASSQAMAESIAANWEDKIIITVGVPVMEAGFLPAMMLDGDHPLPHRFWNILSHKQGVSINRLDQQTFMISSESSLLRGDDLLFRTFADRPMKPGEEYAINGATIRIIDVDELGRPLALQLHVQITDRPISLFYKKENTLKPMNLEVKTVRSFES